MTSLLKSIFLPHSGVLNVIWCFLFFQMCFEFIYSGVFMLAPSVVQMKHVQGSAVAPGPQNSPVWCFCFGAEMDQHHPAVMISFVIISPLQTCMH